MITPDSDPGVAPASLPAASWTTGTEAGPTDYGSCLGRLPEAGRNDEQKAFAVSFLGSPFRFAKSTLFLAMDLVHKITVPFSSAT